MKIGPVGFIQLGPVAPEPSNTPSPKGGEWEPGSQGGRWEVGGGRWEVGGGRWEEGER